MAGLVPAIHDFETSGEGVDARHKAGHDELRKVLLAKTQLGGFAGGSDGGGGLGRLRRSFTN